MTPIKALRAALVHHLTMVMESTHTEHPSVLRALAAKYRALAEVSGDTAATARLALARYLETQARKLEEENDR